MCINQHYTSLNITLNSLFTSSNEWERDGRSDSIVFKGFLLPLTVQSSGVSALSAYLNTLEMKYSYMLFLLQLPLPAAANTVEKTSLLLKLFARVPVAVCVLRHCALPSIFVNGIGLILAGEKVRLLSQTQGQWLGWTRSCAAVGEDCGPQRCGAPSRFPDLAQ